MKKFFILGVSLCLLVLGSTEAQARKAILKIGPGIYFDDSLIGGVGSIDIEIAKEGKVNFGPWASAFVSKSSMKLYAGGVQLIIKVPAGESGKIYFGVGGGYGQIKAGGLDGTGASYSIPIGIEIGATEQITIFGQAQFLGVFGGKQRVTVGSFSSTIDLDARSLSIGAGIAINFGSE